MGRRVLICGLNWLGDYVMSLPAIQLYRDRNPDIHIGLLVKPAIRPLAEATPAVDALHALGPGLGGTWQAIVDLRGAHYDEALILPNSFRSALIPFLARIARRRGTARHGRSPMLTERAAPTEGTAHAHQSWEAARILDVTPAAGGLPPPALVIPEAVSTRCVERLGLTGSGWIGLIPGAARGPSKRWPAERFADVGRRLSDETGADVVIFGAPGERALCEEVAQAIGPHAVSVGGRTSVQELVGLLGRCRVAIVNDSGGMHLAAAAGTPLVAIFGVTDPTRTGPLSNACRIVRADVEQASRDVPRDSTVARSALASIRSDVVLEAARELMGPGGERT